MKKKQHNDEIDLLEIFDIIWRKKIIIAIITFLLLLITYFSEINKDTTSNKIIASTELRPISIYHETEYKIYNLYVNTIRPYYLDEEFYNLIQRELRGSEYTTDSPQIFVYDLGINNINKKFLLNLFIDTLNERSNIINAIKNYNLINEKNYSSKADYEKEIFNLAYSFEFVDGIIKFDASKIVDWNNFLKFLEKQINNEVRLKLLQMFDDYIKYVNTINKYIVEDIEIQLSNDLTETQRNNFERQKEALINDNYVKRLEKIFNKSPVSNADVFHAAKVVFDTIKFEKSDNYTKNTSFLNKIFIAGISGLILGIFFVLILNAVQKRK